MTAEMDIELYGIVSSAMHETGMYRDVDIVYTPSYDNC